MGALPTMCDANRAAPWAKPRDGFGKIKKEPNQEPMLSDFEPRRATLDEDTAGQSPSGDGQPQPRLP